MSGLSYRAALAAASLSIFIVLSCQTSGLSARPRASTESSPRFSGMSDASGAAWLEGNLFVVADDELNILRVYDVDRPGAPVGGKDIGDLLEVGKAEADIEAIARFGDHIYLTVSHGRNRNGRWRESRDRMVALTIKATNDGFDFELMGKPCKTLLEAMLASEELKDLDLASAVGFGEKKAPELAPKLAGMNIEGLGTADGKTFYIGLRNPLRPGPTTQKAAIAIPLLNAQDVFLKQAQPRFDKPLLWDLGGQGIRSLDYSSVDECFYVVAGNTDERHGWALYRWDGRRQGVPRKIGAGGRKRPGSLESLVFFPSGRVLGLLDEGSLRVRATAEECRPGHWEDGMCEQKALLDPARRGFHGIWLDLSARQANTMPTLGGE